MPAKKHARRAAPDCAGKGSLGASPWKAATTNVAAQGSATPKAALRKKPTAGVMSNSDKGCCQEFLARCVPARRAAAKELAGNGSGGGEHHAHGERERGRVEQHAGLGGKEGRRAESEPDEQAGAGVCYGGLLPVVSNPIHDDRFRSSCRVT